MKRKLQSLLLVLCLLLTLLPTAALAGDGAETSGTCGENLKWTLVDRTVTISGTGEMYDYTPNAPAPWSNPKDLITAVIIEDGVTSIGNYAFHEDYALRSVQISADVTSIGTCAFTGCTGLTSIDIPYGVTSIGSSAFASCSKLASIVLPNSVTSIGDTAFSSSGLIDIVIPGSVAHIGNSAFNSAKSLSKVTILYGVIDIGMFAFSGCTSLSEILIPKTVNKVDVGAFYGCTNLHEVKYLGSVAERSVVSIQRDNDPLRNALWIPFAEIPGKAPTCTESGTPTKWSDAAGRMFTIGEKGLQEAEPDDIIPPTGHSWLEPTYTWLFDDNTVTAQRVCQHDQTHIQEETVSATGETTPATCAEEGKTVYTSAAFQNPAFEVQTIAEILPIDPSTHKLTKTEALAPAGDMPGNIAYWTCSVCHKIFADADATREITQEETILPPGRMVPDCDGTACILEEAFTDIDIRKWYHLDVEFVYLNQIMRGNDDHTFAPEAPISRAEFAQVLYNLAGNPEVSGTTSFTDVKPEDWEYNAVLWAEKAGITKGDGTGRFDPNSPVLREQIAVFLYRQAGSPETKGEPSKFTDAAQVDSWALDAVKWAVEQDILQGYDGKLKPTDQALRCESAAMLHRWAR